MTPRRCRCAVIAALLSQGVAAGALSAQESARITVAPGAEVRVTPRAPGSEPSVARAGGIVGDTLLLSTPPRRIALADLSALEVRAGRDRRRGVTIGAASFGVVTVVAGGIDYGRGDITLGDFVGTTIGNVAVGAALGYLLAPTGWLKLPLPGR